MPRQKKYEKETAQLNVRLEADLLEDLFSEYPRLGLKEKQDAAADAIALLLAFSGGLRKFFRDHPRRSFASSQDMAGAFRRWLEARNAQAHGVLAPDSTGNDDSTLKTSFNFPENLLRDFRAAATNSGKNQTEAAKEAFNLWISQITAGGPEAVISSENPGINSTFAIKRYMETIRSTLDQMEALLAAAPGDHIVVESGNRPQPEENSAITIAQPAGPHSDGTGSDQSIDQIILKAHQDNERDRRKFDIDRRKLGDITRSLEHAGARLEETRRTLPSEEDDGGRASDPGRKTG